MTTKDIAKKNFDRGLWSVEMLVKLVNKGKLTSSEYEEIVGSAYIEEPLEVIKQRKITELKYQRDTAEVTPIAYNGHRFDYDDKARDRINAAIIALSLQGEGASIDWTTADNQDVKVTADDLRAIVAAVAVRSNTLHTAYRAAKAQVEAAVTADEVRAVCMEL